MEKKTVKRATVGDIVFKVQQNTAEYTQVQIDMVKKDNIYLDYFDVKRTNDHTIKYGSHIYFFNEIDAIRYCKSQMMKILFGKIDLAKKAIEEVKEYRLKNHELLNHKWTESEINKLQNQLK